MTDNQYLDQCALEDKYTKPPTIWELSKAFNDQHSRKIARKIKQDLINELGFYKYFIKIDPIYKIFMKFDPRARRVNEISKFLRYSAPVDESNPKSELDVEKAKQVPIAQLYEFSKGKHGQKIFQASCPFHKDDKPSFAIYKQSNTFKCFSCQQHGDSIEFIRKLYNVGFVDAVRRLTHEH